MTSRLLIGRILSYLHSSFFLLIPVISVLSQRCLDKWYLVCCA